MICHLELKPGVRLHGLGVEIAWASERVRELWEEMGATACVITSAGDGVHQQLGGHYTGNALDFRTKTLPGGNSLIGMRNALSARLGPDFFILLEAVGQENEHLHVEFRPGKG